VAPRAADVARPFQNLNAAVYDWSIFWYEAAAEYINSLSQLAKRLDPSRRTVTYLTMSWAFPSEWDETQRSAIAPDEVAMHGKDIDIFGMQLCAADGDPCRVTACLDLMRKYEKPLWAVDLVDFTSGVHIGYPAMDRITQATIQHGASGIIYCAWHIPTVLDYSFHPNMRGEDINQMLNDARAAVHLMRGMQVHAAVALAEPILPASPADDRLFKNDYRSFVGWYKVLERLHRTVDVVTLREIDVGQVQLDQYAWILVPDCAYLTEAAWQRLADYVKAGGRLVTTEKFGLYDEIGRPRDATANPLPHLTLPDYGRAYGGDPIRDTHAGNTPPLFLWRSDTPEAQVALAAAGQSIETFLEQSNVPRQFELVDAGPDIRAVYYVGMKRCAVYLVNVGTQDSTGGQLRIRANQPSQADVYADVRPTDCAVQRSNEWVELSLPPFRSSCVVMVREVRP
jgi:hypothetical protein